MNDNGDMPAFPMPDVLDSNGRVWSEGDIGLTKREWLAGMAMQSFTSRGGVLSIEDNARYAVIQADALLAELAKGGAK